MSIQLRPLYAVQINQGIVQMYFNTGDGGQKHRPSPLMFSNNGNGWFPYFHADHPKTADMLDIPSNLSSSVHKIINKPDKLAKRAAAILKACTPPAPLADPYDEYSGLTDAQIEEVQKDELRDYDRRLDGLDHD